MNNRKLYFDVPTQVAFWEDNHYIGGIAYGAEIICSSCWRRVCVCLWVIR